MIKVRGASGENNRKQSKYKLVINAVVASMPIDAQYAHRRRRQKWRIHFHFILARGDFN